MLQKLKTIPRPTFLTIALLAGSCLLGTSAQAQTFGERYLDLGGFYARAHGGGAFDTYGGNFQVNLPVFQEDEARFPFGLDWRTQYSNAFDNESGVSLKAHRIAVGPLAYYPLRQDFRPFVTALLGHSFSRFKASGGTTERDNTWSYALGAGFEWLPMERLSVAPRIAYSNRFDGSGDVWQYGVETDYWISERFSLGIGYNYFHARSSFTHDIVVRTRILF